MFDTIHRHLRRVRNAGEVRHLDARMRADIGLDAELAPWPAPPVLLPLGPADRTAR